MYREERPILIILRCSSLSSLSITHCEAVRNRFKRKKWNILRVNKRNQHDRYSTIHYIYCPPWKLLYPICLICSLSHWLISPSESPLESQLLSLEPLLAPPTSPSIYKRTSPPAWVLWIVNSTGMLEPHSKENWILWHTKYFRMHYFK